jgi:hypothetical protein
MHVHGLVVLTDGVLGIVELVGQGQLLFVHLGPHGLGQVSFGNGSLYEY